MRRKLIPADAADCEFRWILRNFVYRARAGGAPELIVVDSLHSCGSIASYFSWNGCPGTVNFYRSSRSEEIRKGLDTATVVSKIL